MGSNKPLYKNIKLNCTIVADTHIDIKHPVPAVPKYFLKSALTDAKKSKTNVDAFIIIGDTTSRSSKINWEMATDCFNKINFPKEKTLLAIGNHDTWDDEGEEVAIGRYLSYAGNIMGTKLEKTYFTRIINGYHFIFLGSEKDELGAYISDEQVAWLDEELNNASETNLPVFVFCHQSINQKHGLPKTFDKDEDPNAGPFDGGIGPASDKVLSVLEKYKNVFYFSGHSHMGIGGKYTMDKFGYSSFEDYGDLHTFNLPSLACGNHHCEYKKLGSGVQLEVYDDRICIRPRNFSSHSYVRSVVITDEKPYYEFIFNK